MAAASVAMGRPLMPHQREIVDVFLEVQSEEAGDPEPGEWAYDDGTALLERRAGKTAIQAPLVTHRARLVRGAQMFMTAQNRNKARRRWMDITTDLLASPLKRDIRRKVSISHEELRWLDGDACLVPFAPNEDEMHSETPDLVLIDELWAFDAQQAKLVKAGYVPAFATSSGQALKMSTAGTEMSHWLNDERLLGRQAVRDGVRRGRFYYEHSLPNRVGGVPIKKLSDEQLVAACIANHPAVCHLEGCPGPRQKRPCPHGFTIRPAAIAAAWESINDRAEFLRGFGNRTANDEVELWTAITEQLWTDQTDEAGIPASVPVAFGVWVDEDGADVAVSSGWRDDLGRMHVETVELLEGTTGIRDWFLAKPSRRRTPVAIANTGEARNVADALEAADVTVMRISQADLPAAVSRHRQELKTGLWWHRAHDGARDSAAAAGLHKSRGGQTTWERPGDSISILGSHTLAGWGYDHRPPPSKFWMG